FGFLALAPHLEIDESRDGFGDPSACSVVGGVHVHRFAVLVDDQLRDDGVTSFERELPNALSQSTGSGEQVDRPECAPAVDHRGRLRSLEVSPPPRSLRVDAYTRRDLCVDHDRVVHDDSATDALTFDTEELAVAVFQRGEVERLLDTGHTSPWSSSVTRSRNSSMKAAASISS